MEDRNDFNNVINLVNRIKYVVARPSKRSATQKQEYFLIQKWVIGNVRFHLP